MGVNLIPERKKCCSIKMSASCIRSAGKQNREDRQDRKGLDLEISLSIRPLGGYAPAPPHTLLGGLRGWFFEPGNSAEASYEGILDQQVCHLLFQREE